MPKDYDDSWEDDEADIEDIRFVSNSGNIVGVRYNPKTEKLWIDFHNGTYVYRDVPEAVAHGFEGASSATLYANDQIKGAFEYDAE